MVAGGACMVARGHACMVATGVHGCWGEGACVVAGGVCVVARGHAWLWGVHRIRRDTVNERAVRILLECILVLFCAYLSNKIPAPNRMM